MPHIDTAKTQTEGSPPQAIPVPDQLREILLEGTGAKDLPPATQRALAQALTNRRREGGIQ